MARLKTMPLLLYLFLALQMILLTRPEILALPVFKTTLPSDGSLTPTLMDIFAMAGVAVLYMALIKHLRNRPDAFFSPFLPTILLIILFVEFLFHADAATISFLIFMLITLLHISLPLTYQLHQRQHRS
ncbi:hypothetical protein ACQZV8_15395 [Magnetococcales bacterium HHB-1]